MLTLKRFFLAAAIVLAAFLCVLTTPTASAQAGNSPAVAQPSDQQFQPPSDEEIAMLRKDIRSKKKQLIAANMKLTDAEAEKFWPVYDAYTAELVKINDTKYGLIQQYLQTYTTMTDAEADSFTKRWIGVDESVAQLRLKYIPNFRKVLSAKNTALFFQLDRRMSMMIDLQLASQVPLAEP